MAVQINRASPERLEPLASVLGRSFVVEPMLRWSLGEHGDVAERFTRYFANGLERLLPLGVVWEAGDAVGAALWFPPHGAEVYQDVHSRDPRVKALTLDEGRRFSAFWEWVESKMPEEPVWHLGSVAVEPEARGRGIGSALVEHGLTLARADRVRAVLETGNPRNVPYYETFGFHIVDEADAPEGGPRVWFMRRDHP